MMNKGRTAGFFYLLTIVAGGFAFSAVSSANLEAHSTLFRLGVTANVIATACYVVVTALFWNLFRPVNENVSLLAAFFSLVGCAIGAMSSALQLVALAVPDGPRVLKMGATASQIGLVFFGFYCLLIGYLIFKSGFLPRFLGVLMAFGGLGWLTNLFPPLASALSSYAAIPGVLGEGALTVWLLVAGVNEQPPGVARTN
jgi:hypothetical protein